MTIAVTGATGHLGRHVIDTLLTTQAPADIVAIVRNPDKAAPLAELGVQVRVAPYTDTTALGEALAGVDRLLLISSSEVGQRFAQHKNVIDAAAAAGVRQIAYTSVLNATTTPLILAPEHKATEEYLAASGIATTLLRNGWYTENYAGLVAEAREHGTVTAAAGEGRVASATRADYAAAAAAVLQDDSHLGKTYELSGDVAWSFAEFADTLSELLGRPVRYASVTPDELAATLTAAGVPADGAGFAAALDADTAAGYLSETTGDLSRLIGRPTTPLATALAAL
ncbi:SDR family oxidoreductase [Mycetocola reblochoni]|uniref:NADPH:quinone oxidoreductase 2 n=2 Tax=Mycetocola reblochoni TaxID=331618 RepID=A0A1R4JVC3_9MICO|nr:SDR family oxidoreductase [Mycetocola reblochoni]RLP68441.1 SDR family oxidoreductase [Mycetocola reblochoni]SJN35912.1 NADPH:quinone oxidoreductase 2 [Mycetocola reblochoni REB411]